MIKKLEGEFYFYKGFLIQLTESGFCRFGEVVQSRALDVRNGSYLERLPKIVEDIYNSREKHKKDQEKIVNSAIQKVSSSLVHYLDLKCKDLEGGKNEK